VCLRKEIKHTKISIYKQNILTCLFLFFKQTIGSYKCDKNKSEGAPPPYIIYSDKKKKDVEKNLTLLEKQGPYAPKIQPVNTRFLTNLIAFNARKEWRTSIWSQPNNNGTIKRLHACMEEATLRRRRWNRAVIPYFNAIIFDAWQNFLTREASDLIAGGNNATGAFARTGLFPFNPTSDSWEEAIDSLGIHNSLEYRFHCFRKRW